MSERNVNNCHCEEQSDEAISSRLRRTCGPHNNNIRKILIVRFSSLGDIVMSTALIRCLRQAYPSAQIDMVVREDFLDIIRHNPHLDRKIGLDRRSGLRGLYRLTAQINRERYDLIYDAHWSLRTLFIRPWLKADYFCKFEKHYLRRALALTFKMPLLTGMDRMLVRYLDPLKPFGVIWDAQGPELFLDEHSVSAVHLEDFSENVPWIGVIPSAQWPGKRWPAERFRTLVQKIVEHSPYTTIVFGGNNDHFCADICKGMPPSRVMNTQGRLSILEAAAIMKKCRLVVANDTGLMHVADGLNIPCVLILGPTSKELGCLPFHPRSRIVEQTLWCRPCSKNGQAPCLRSERYCLTAISSERVWQECEALMGEVP
ncbi:MAG: glycosyltransferase family 9 protein [Deltaproteobacteria bacterium]|nr:glycosyltransferase family 9 protein [Deltaproteobacteria bacterium]